jgi:probable rRNA maturation factor
MIEFHYETTFQLDNEKAFISWLSEIVASEQFLMGDVNFIFCNDEYLLKVNQEYLNHDTYTDIITFDYSEGKTLHGDVFVSIERVKENALSFEVGFQDELLRVMSHGVLHLSGYKDKSDKDAALMRKKEDEKMAMFHVER